MSEPSSPEWAASRFDEHVRLARPVRERCVAVWRLIQASGRQLSDFPVLGDHLDDLRAIEFDFLREASFERQFDPESAEDASRHARNLAVLEKIDSWWRKFEADLEAEITSIRSQLSDSAVSPKGNTA